MNDKNQFIWLLKVAYHINYYRRIAPITILACFTTAIFKSHETLAQCLCWIGTGILITISLNLGNHLQKLTRPKWLLNAWNNSNDKDREQFGSLLKGMAEYLETAQSQKQNPQASTILKCMLENNVQATGWEPQPQTLKLLENPNH